MRDTQEIETLIWSLKLAIEKETRLQQARDKYQGYSFDYFFNSDIEATRDAAVDFARRLTEYIDKRVAEALAKRDSS
jgi:hypothetical protein